MPDKDDGAPHMVRHHRRDPEPPMAMPSWSWLSLAILGVAGVVSSYLIYRLVRTILAYLPTTP
jgi:hypothetical protein